MELNINLANRGLSFFRIVFGGLFLLFSCRYFIKVINSEYFSFWDLLIFGSGIPLTIFMLIEGFGYPLGKAYVLINSELISFKPTYLQKERLVYWNEVKSIDYNPYHGKFKIKKTDGTTTTLKLFDCGYIIAKQFKEAIDYFAKEKNIPIQM